MRREIVPELGGFEAPERQCFMSNNENFIAAQNPRTTAPRQQAQRIHSYGVHKHTTHIRNQFLSFRSRISVGFVN